MPVARVDSRANASSVWSATTLTFALTAMRRERLGLAGTAPYTPCSAYSPEWMPVREREGEGRAVGRGQGWGGGRGEQWGEEGLGRQSSLSQ